MPPARELIESSRATVWVSPATIWEIAIKRSLAPGGWPMSGQDALDYFRQSGYHLLAVQSEHAAAVETLPAHPADPFDRISIAPALIEPMRLLKHDAMVARYPDTFIAV